MSSQIRALGRHSLVYGAGIILGKLASFIMLPVYTRYLTPADYGVLELLGMTIDVIGMIAGIGLASSVFKFYADAEGQEEKNRVISTAAIAAVGLASLASALGFLFSPLLSETVIGEAGNATYFRLYFLIYLLQNFEYVPLMLMRAKHRSTLFVSVNVAKLVSMLSLNIYFVVHLRMGVMGVLTSNLITGAIVAAALTVYLVRQAGVHFSMSHLRDMARFGNPMILWSLSSFVLVFSDRYFLNHYAGTGAVGVYSLAYKFAFMVSSFAYQPFRLVWEPQRFEIAKRADALDVYTRVFLYMNVIVGTAGLAITLFVRDFLGVMADPAFFSAYKVAPLLIAAQIVFLWVNYCNVGLFLKSKTRVMGVVGVVGAAATILLNFLLIPRFGIFGAAWATLAAYGLRFWLIQRVSQRHYHVPYDWGTVAHLYAIFLVAGGLSFAFHPEGRAASIAWSTLLLIGAVAAVYRQILGPRERDMIRAFLHRTRFALPVDASRA